MLNKDTASLEVSRSHEQRLEPRVREFREFRTASLRGITVGSLSIDLKLKRIIVNYIESCMVKLSMKFSGLQQNKKIVNDLLQPYNQTVNFNMKFSYKLKPYKTTVNDFFAITAILSIFKLLNLDLS